MDIFHYLAEQLHGVPNFECGTNYVPNAESGAIYNDFDCDPREALGGIDNDSTFSQDQTHTETQTGLQKVSVPRECIDHAILEADREHGILYEHLSFDSIAFDCTSSIADESYMDKVHQLVSLEKAAWKDLTISSKTIEIFEMRKRAGWIGADSVYDAWLLCNGDKRQWFPYHRFVEKYPYVEETLKVSYEKIHGGHVPLFSSSSSGSSSSSSSSSASSDEETNISSPPKKFMTSTQVTKFLNGKPNGVPKSNKEDSSSDEDFQSAQIQSHTNVVESNQEGTDFYRSLTDQYPRFEVKKEIESVIVIDSD